MRDISLNNYGQITAQERINLTILALARNDIKEADRLYNSCPKYDYKVADKEYNCRLMAIPIINHLFFEQCVYYYNILVKINSTILLLEATSPPCLDEENATRFDRLYQSHDLHVSKLKALYLGFRQFCYQIGIDAEGALHMIGVERCCFDIQRYLDSAIEPAPEDIEWAKAMFLEYWGF
jgi:hypothetical protein